MHCVFFLHFLYEQNLAGNWPAPAAPPAEKLADASGKLAGTRRASPGPLHGQNNAGQFFQNAAKKNGLQNPEIGRRNFLENWPALW